MQPYDTAIPLYLQEPEFQPGVWFNLLRQKLAASFAKGLPFRDRGSITLFFDIRSLEIEFSLNDNDVTV